MTAGSESSTRPRYGKVRAIQREDSHNTAYLVLVVPSRTIDWTTCRRDDVAHWSIHNEGLGMKHLDVPTYALELYSTTGPALSEGDTVPGPILKAAIDDPAVLQQRIRVSATTTTTTTTTDDFHAPSNSS